MITLDYDEAHDFVDREKNFYWDGWDIMYWKPSRNAYSSPEGLFRKGSWGFSKRFTANSDGVWGVSDRFTRG